MNEKIAIAVVLCALMGLSAGQEINGEASGMDDPSVEELAVRLLQSPYLGSSELSEVQLLAGKLPDDMPIDLPLPDGARIVGSEIVGGGAEAAEEINIVIDLPVTQDQALEFYQGALAARNWTVTEMNTCGEERGFVLGDPTVSFRRGPEDPYLTLAPYPRANGTELQVSIINDTEIWHCPLSGDSADWLKPLPRLVAPRGAEQSGENYMSGIDMVAASATLETEMNSSSLADHYTDQLTAENWTLEARGESGPSSWSTWSFMDENDLLWNGFFIALDLPGGENRRFVLMQAGMEV